MTHRRVCNGMVIYVHNNSLEVASVPTGPDQGEIKPCSGYRRLSKLVADRFQWSVEGSVSIHNENGEEGGGPGRQSGPRRVSQAPAAPRLASCSFSRFPAPHPKPKLRLARAGYD